MTDWQIVHHVHDPQRGVYVLALAEPVYAEVALTDDNGDPITEPASGEPKMVHEQVALGPVREIVWDAGDERWARQDGKPRAQDAVAHEQREEARQALEAIAAAEPAPESPSAPPAVTDLGGAGEEL